MNVTIPKKTRNNGTLYAHVFTCPPGESPIANSWTSYALSDLTTYAIPQSETYKLVGGNNKEDPEKEEVRHKSLWRQ